MKPWWVVAAILVVPSVFAADLCVLKLDESGAALVEWTIEGEEMTISSSNGYVTAQVAGARHRMAIYGLGEYFTDATVEGRTRPMQEKVVLVIDAMERETKGIQLPELAWEASGNMSAMYKEQLTGQVRVLPLENACKYTMDGGRIHVEGNFSLYTWGTSAELIQGKPIDPVAEGLHAVRGTNFDSGIEYQGSENYVLAEARAVTYIVTNGTLDLDINRGSAEVYTQMCQAMGGIDDFSGLPIEVNSEGAHPQESSGVDASKGNDLGVAPSAKVTPDNLERTSLGVKIGLGSLVVCLVGLLGWRFRHQFHIWATKAADRANWRLVLVLSLLALPAGGFATRILYGRALLMVGWARSARKVLISVYGEVHDLETRAVVAKLVAETYAARNEAKPAVKWLGYALRDAPALVFNEGSSELLNRLSKAPEVRDFLGGVSAP